MGALDWIREAAIYQIFPDRFLNGDRSNDPQELARWVDQPTRNNFFGGDLKGIELKLDYLQSLGINTIYLNPIFSAPSNHKYDTRDYFHVDPIFGGNSALRNLISCLHNRGMKLILDGVFNHCGEDFFAFQDVIENGYDSAYRDWFNILGFPLTKQPLNYKCCGDASYLPKLNHSNPEVIEYFLNVGKHWVGEYDIDGWRLDVPFKVPKSFWLNFRRTIKSIKSNTYLFGEIWRNASHWVDGETFDGVTNYPLRELILDFCKTRFLDAEDYLYEAKVLRDSVGEGAYGMVNLLGSHDTPRILTLFDGETNQVILAWVLLLTEIGVPLIYYGDEIGMLGINDPDCRRPMVWEDANKNLEIFRIIQALLDLRKNSKALTHGKFENLFSHVGLAAYKRKYAEEEIIVIVNPREEVGYIKIPVRSKQTHYTDFFNGEVIRVVDGNLDLRVFPGNSFRLLHSDNIWI